MSNRTFIGGVSEPARARLHVADRAWERYGIELSLADVIAITLRCKAGEGRTHSDPDGVQHHAIIFNDHVLWMVYKPPTISGKHHNGMLVTVMPPRVAAKIRKDDFNHRARRLRNRRR